MSKQLDSTKKSSFLFQLEILVEDTHHTTALEQVIHKLNKNAFADYRISSGIQLGDRIDKELATKEMQVEIPVEEDITPQEATQIAGYGLDPILHYMKSNTLIRLIVNRGFGVKINIPCRIINVDESDNLITVYHVDEKQVYSFRLTEIEDLVI